MSDQIQSFILNQSEYRGTLVQLQTSYQKIINQHAYPNAIATLLGEALVAVSLMGKNLKQKGRLALQIETQGVLQFLVAEINHEQGVRALAKWRDDAPLRGNLLTEGRFAMTVMPEQGERYQGIVPLVQASIAQSLEAYFGQSEQVWTRILLACDEEKAAGLLLQKLPQTQTHLPLVLEAETLNLIINTLKPEELLNTNHTVLLQKLFSEADITLFESIPMHFACTCTKQKMENTIRVLGKEEAEALLSTHKMIEVSCEFCNDHYVFSPEEVRLLV